MRKLILTNDDGIDAPGLAALYAACRGFGECVVVAPRSHQSGVGHACTTHEPLHFGQVADGWFAVDGTPVDCTRIAVTHLASDADVVVAGINEGGNLGADFYTSGTVAAAREGIFLGRRSIAVSQYIRPDVPIDWEVTAEWARAVVKMLLERPGSPDEYFSVNLPHVPERREVPEMRFCGLDPRQVKVDFDVHEHDAGGQYTATYQGDYHGRPCLPRRDIEVCFGGEIAVTKIPVDITGHGGEE